MPLITAKTNVNFTKENELKLKSEFASILAECFPGKTEQWLMVDFEFGHSMYFAGTDDPCMLVTIDIFGTQADHSYEMMTEKMCAIVSKECGIPSNRIYVKYSEVERWGWNGGNF